MPLTTLHEAPALDSFTPLADHQSQTPASFYGAKPVLHYHATAARAVAPREKISKLPIFGGSEQQSETSEGEEPVSVVLIDAYVSSE